MRVVARLSELTRVRLAARGGALAVALLLGIIAAQRAVPVGGPNSDAAPAISVTIVALEPVQARSPVVRRRSTHEGGASLPAPTDEGSGGGQVTVWLDGAAGKVAFDNSEHYMRCLEASLAHIDAPGCPERAHRQVLARAGED